MEIRTFTTKVFKKKAKHKRDGKSALVRNEESTNLNSIRTTHSHSDKTELKKIRTKLSKSYLLRHKTQSSEAGPTGMKKQTQHP